MSVSLIHGSRDDEMGIAHRRREKPLVAAERHDADLIVIGAYSNARSTQILFGGVTQAILKQATIPVLMSR